MGKHNNTNTFRTGRVNDLLQRELALLIRDGCKDPRVGFVTVSAVEVTRDLAHAKVFITVLEDKQVESTLAALNHAAGFFRSTLSKRVNLRTIPKLKFLYDPSICEGHKIESILKTTQKPGDDS